MTSLANYLSMVVGLSLRRLALATSTRPQWRDLQQAVGLLLGFAVLVVPLGLWSHWLSPTLATVSWAHGLKLAGRVFLVPALVEEGFWRVLLLPHRSELRGDRRRWLIGLPVLVLFVLMHLVSSRTVYPAGFPTFTTPMFMFSATLLGLMCTVAYWQSGSGWVAVALHWAIVFTWLMFLGGYGQLHLG